MLSSSCCSHVASAQEQCLSCSCPRDPEIQVTVRQEHFELDGQYKLLYGNSSSQQPVSQLSWYVRIFSWKVNYGFAQMLENNITCASEPFEKLLHFSFLELLQVFFSPGTGEGHSLHSPAGSSEINFLESSWSLPGRKQSPTRRAYPEWAIPICWPDNSSAFQPLWPSCAGKCSGRIGLLEPFFHIPS